FNDAARALRLVTAALQSARFDRERLAERASQGWITITELADTLTRDHGVPFKTSHAIASRVVSEASAESTEPVNQILARVSRSLTGKPVEYDERPLAEILSPVHFVRVRRTYGGPAPEETRRAIEASRSALDEDQQWMREAIGKLRNAEQLLRDSTA